MTKLFKKQSAHHPTTPGFIDLHLHSNYSEGRLSIARLIQEVKRFDVKVISLTDHNTIAGVAAAIKIGGRQGLKVISGVEIYTRFNKHRLHLLGYNFDIDFLLLQKTLDQLADQRTVDVLRSLSALQRQGFKINQKRLFDSPSRYIGLGQIIHELYQTPANIKKIKQEMKTLWPAFFNIINYYFGEKKKACLPETSLPIKQTIDLIHQAGGLVVLAHPSQQLGWDTNTVVKLKNLGLDGLEAISPYHNWHDLEHWQKVARVLKLIVTGGSDFHTFLPEPPRPLIKEQWQCFKVPYSIYQQMKPQLNKYK